MTPPGALGAGQSSIGAFTLARLRLRRRWRPNSLEMPRDEGILVHLGAKVLNVRGRSGQALSLLHAPFANQTIESSDILVAAGRTPNTAGIGVEAAGVAVVARGYIAVNDRLETSAPVVWAIGECAGSPQFTVGRVGPRRPERARAEAVKMPPTPSQTEILAPSICASALAVMSCSPRWRATTNPRQRPQCRRSVRPNGPSGSSSPTGQNRRDRRSRTGS